jgi:hypothetical protein
MASVMTVVAVVAVVAMAVVVTVVVMMVPAAERVAEQRSTRANRQAGHQTVGHGGARTGAAVDYDWRRLDGVCDRLPKDGHDGLPGVHDWLRIHWGGRRVCDRMGHWHRHRRGSAVSCHWHGSGAIAVCTVDDWL